jgi:hypothetical protein
MDAVFRGYDHYRADTYIHVLMENVPSQRFEVGQPSPVLLVNYAHLRCQST